MKPEIKHLWIEALRSKKYKQGVGQLCKGGKHCCLGVLCEVAIENGVDLDRKLSADDENTIIFGEYSTAYLPKQVLEWAGLDHKDGVFRYPSGKCETLTRLNDHGKSFDKISDVIEEHF